VGNNIFGVIYDFYSTCRPVLFHNVVTTGDINYKFSLASQENDIAAARNSFSIGICCSSGHNCYTWDSDLIRRAPYSPWVR
jgi:hypothetical protein